jgi:hypothetical protein
MSRGLVGEAVVTTTSTAIVVRPAGVRQMNEVGEANVVMHTGGAITVIPDPVPSK